MLPDLRRLLPGLLTVAKRPESRPTTIALCLRRRGGDANGRCPEGSRFRRLPKSERSRIRIQQRVSLPERSRHAPQCTTRGVPRWRASRPNAIQRRHSSHACSVCQAQRPPSPLDRRIVSGRWACSACQTQNGPLLRAGLVFRCLFFYGTSLFGPVGAQEHVVTNISKTAADASCYPDPL